MKIVDDLGKTLCEIEWQDHKLAIGHFTDEFGSFRVIIEEESKWTLIKKNKKKTRSMRSLD